MDDSERGFQVKKELLQLSSQKKLQDVFDPVLIDLGSSDSDSDSDSDSSSSGEDDVTGSKRSRGSNGNGGFMLKKRRKSDGSGVVLPPGFLDPLPPKEVVRPPLAVVPSSSAAVNGIGNVLAEVGKVKQFWKAGDFEGAVVGDWEKSTGGMDRVRVHPRFLHSNATSHKWVLGAFAELLDNSLDEVVNGATFVKIDMIKSKKDGSRMLLIEDNGGGMDADKMRQCMSLGYSVKSKIANTIGQYGNGFKTSTMRLGADVIVFSQCSGKDGKRPTQSIGLLSYTFLRSTGKEDIVVPMLDYERDGLDWTKIIRSSAADWNRNVETIVQWSPFSSEAELFRQFNQMKDHGTRIIIYNLWEDDQGLLELDFDSEKHDIQIRGVNRDDKNIQMAQQYPNSRHFLTYRHSLRSYVSILYLRIPPGFRIILRGKDVEHHNIVNDMMMTQEVTYRPHPGVDGIPKDFNMVAVVTMGFVKDAKAHIDVQGFNVYHKNRLIKPFWRVWNAAGSDGRGVIGVLEANFIEPAHDKQGFERTIVLSRLETKLVQIQKTYWSTNCHKIGYAARCNKKLLDDREPDPEYLPQLSSIPPRNSTISSSKTPVSGSAKYSLHKSLKHGGKEAEMFPKIVDKSYGSGNHMYSNGESGARIATKSRKERSYVESTSPSVEDISADNMQNATPERQENGGPQKELSLKKSFRSDGSTRVLSPTHLEHTEAERISSSGGRVVQINVPLQSKGDDVNGKGGSPSNYNSLILDQLKENHELKDRLKEKEEEISGNMPELQSERDRCISLVAKLLEATRRIEEMNKEQESLIDIFSEERERRDFEEDNLRKKLKDASNTIQELLDKVRVSEKVNSSEGNLNR